MRMSPRCKILEKADRREVWGKYEAGWVERGSGGERGGFDYGGGGVIIRSYNTGKINKSWPSEEGRHHLLLEIEVLRYLLILLRPALSLATGFCVKLESRLARPHPHRQFFCPLLVNLLYLAAPQTPAALLHLRARYLPQPGSINTPACEVSADELRGRLSSKVCELGGRVGVLSPPFKLYKDIFGIHVTPLLNYIENQRILM